MCGPEERGSTRGWGDAPEGISVGGYDCEEVDDWRHNGKTRMQKYRLEMSARVGPGKEKDKHFGIHFTDRLRMNPSEGEATQYLV